ncbi:MAG TPA: CRISPR system precrRNA processing endoribonuclease RAMP protein Cas6 [Aggregatilinea sp.]|uniref:CRISPR system precrRNA processing endoribonuclease RAMP protein Cas6 n=1 Tax=Aggregatilinea sp. TaxID=2806333 RepID=UPI002B7E96CE|nr:CRISPR system precrRNA processing endoribonuclease RAMP protein Cas6 [Aggregatilinea sp.]HML22996.1 CRISPR system precrRNA processing endoribonuclease RAMP protein Cas6 [Aggregatilinea sp.]
MIPLTLLDVHISASYPLDFGANPGSSIRGALYETLRTMYDTGAAVRAREDVDENPTAWLLRLEDDETSGGKDVPRPIAIRPPLTAGVRDTSFGVSLYGRGQDQLPMVLSALNAMQQIGLGRGRNRFTLDRIDLLDPITYQPTPLLDGQGHRLGDLRTAPGEAAYVKLAEMLRPDRIAVDFLTPTRIVEQKHLVHEPQFKPWFQRLLERIRVISEVYTDTPVWVPFKDLLADAERVTLAENDTRWIEMWSGSRRDGAMRPTSGFAGRAVYEGDLSRVLPWLVLGQAIQVGKNTVKGCGWYRLRYAWR